MISRRSLRLWPVKGSGNNKVSTETIRFLRDKLRVPEEDMKDNQIERIRRIRSAKTSRIQFEVSVLFEDVYTRDRVSSHAKNLSNFFKQDGSPSAGLKIEYPEFLGYNFRCLDWYGKDLKTRYGNEFCRNIRFDDDRQNLCMDIKFPDCERWERISADLAVEEKKAFDLDNESVLRTRLRRPRPLGRPPDQTTQTGMTRAPHQRERLHRVVHLEGASKTAQTLMKSSTSARREDRTKIIDKLIMIIIINFRVAFTPRTNQI